MNGNLSETKLISDRLAFFTSFLHHLPYPSVPLPTTLTYKGAYSLTRKILKKEKPDFAVFNVSTVIVTLELLFSSVDF